MATLNQTQPKDLNSGSSERLALTLLVGQSTSLGLALSLLLTTATTLFLAEFGAERLPYAYIAIAIFVSALFFGLAELQRRWTLSKLAINAVLGFIGLLCLSWLALTQPNTGWVAFVLMVAFYLGIQVGFVLLGGQAGRLFDVRQIKRHFPLIVTGFAVGFTLGGLAISPLLTLLARVENLLLIAVFSMVSMLIFLLVVISRFRAKLDFSEQAGGPKKPPKPIRHLLKNQYVALIFLYQMLSAMGTQLVEFIFFSQAAARYTQAVELAQFFGNFIAVLNVVDILFVSLVAGFLMTRFGMGFGLSANPLVVGGILVTMAVGAVILGPWHPLIFWLAAGARILDIAFSDGATRTAINAAYQALPEAERITVQTTVEGIGVPVALGLTGLILLLFNAIPSLTMGHIIFFAVLLTILWAAAGFFVFRDYASVLLNSLSRRVLGDVALSLDDSSSLAVVQKLLQSSKLNEVRLALDLLEQAEHETFGPSLITLADHPQADIRTDALSRIARLQLLVALPVVEQRLMTETDPAAKGAALHALCALTEAEAVDLVPNAYLDDPEPEIRLGAMAGLLRYGGISGVLEAGLPLTFLVDDVEPEQRAFAAQVIGEVGQHSFYRPLLPLLADEDSQVRLAALTAAGQVRHTRLLPLVIDNLADPTTRAEAMAALVVGGEVVLPLIGQALAGDEAQYDQDTIRRLVRVCGQIKGEQVIDLLKQYLDHPIAEVQHQILLSLNLCGYRARPDEQERLEQALPTLIEHGARVLLAKQELGEDEALTPLQAALDHEFSHIRRRIFLLLSFIYEPRAMLRAEERLDRGSRSEKALAIETLDVTLASEQKAMILPLIDDSLTPAQRVQSLGQQVALTQLGREQRLKEIIVDSQVWGQDWTRACAIYACGQLALKELAEAVENALSLTDAVVQETAAWALQTLDPEQYQAQVTALATEDNL